MSYKVSMSNQNMIIGNKLKDKIIEYLNLFPDNMKYLNIYLQDTFKFTYLGFLIKKKLSW